MGQEILYCVDCQTQLRGIDFEKQRAFRIDGQPYCLKCFREVVKEIPAERAASILNPGPPAAGGNISEKRGSRTTQILRIAGTPKSTRRVFRAASSQYLFLAIGGVAALLVVGVGIATMSGSTASVSRSGSFEEPRPPVVELSSSSPVPPRADPSPSEAGRAPELTPEEARGPVIPTLARLDEEIKGALLREEFGQALRLIETARSQDNVPQWNRIMNERAGEARARAEEAFLVLKAKAVVARRTGDLEELRRIKERLSRWEIARMLPELEVALAGVAPPGPVPAPPEIKVPVETPEASLFRSQRERAFELAGARDYAEAVALLERGMKTLREEKLRAEVAADLESFRKATALYAESLQILSKWPAGQKIRLAYDDESGKPRTIEGPGYSVEPHRIEVRGVDSSASVPLGEVRAAAWTAILKARKPIDAGTAAILCLLEGDPATAKERLGDTAAAIPDPYWTLSQTLAEVPVAPREKEARQRFHFAERQYSQFTVTSEAVLGYEALLRDYGDTAFVRRNRLAMAPRIQGGREFFFGFPDLTSGGTFASSKNARGDFVWTSDADSEEARATENFIELAFSVVPDAEYRAWVFVGGCCAETLTFRAEISDGAAVSPVKQNVATGVRRHAGHGGPKQPARWGWVQIPLPKFSSPGPKTLRLCTNQKGFSVACGIVTALRGAPPHESEVRELEKTRDHFFNAALTAGLVGRWTFDEGAGTTTVDRTGNGNTATLRAGATWDVGPGETALKFDGLNEGLSCGPKGFPAANARQSITFWFFYEAVPTASQVMVVLSAKNSGVYSGFHFLAGPACRVGTWKSGGPFLADAPVPLTRKWNHYAYTFDGARHRLYLNGTSAGTSAVAPQTAVPQSLGFGAQAGSSKEAFRGKLDDVRVYSRALTAQEVVLLVRNGR